jgi:hypothetical protein
MDVLVEVFGRLLPVGWGRVSEVVSGFGLGCSILVLGGDYSPSLYRLNFGVELVFD